MLAAAHRFRPDRFHLIFVRHRRWSFAIGALCLVPVLVCEFGSVCLGTIGYTLLFVACALAVGLAVATDERKGTGQKDTSLVVRKMAWLGRISYTVYLWHLLVLVFVELLFERSGLGATVVELLAFVVASIAMGWLAAWAIERPGLRLRERWIPATRSQERKPL